MAYVAIAKDLTAIRSAVIMGLSKRQTICFGAAAVMGLPFFFFLRRFVPVSAAAMLMLIVMLPWFLFAMYEQNGLPLEQYLMRVISVKFRRPKIRTYQTHNLYAATGRQIQLYREVQDIVSDQSAHRDKADAAATSGDCRCHHRRKRRPA